MKGDGRASTNGQTSRFDLEGRLLVLASAVVDLSEELPQTRAGLHVGGQILRSGTSPYSNHGEAEAAESRDDFIHKMGVCLKELRETRRWARLVRHRGWCEESVALGRVLADADELVRIFSASIRTAPGKSGAALRLLSVER
jgi:four helix bundle protein